MSVQKISKVIFTIALTLIIAASAAFAAEAPGNRQVLSVGSSTFSESEVLRLIMGSSGNEMMAALMLSQSTLSDRKEIVGQIADAVLFAEGGKGEKLDQDPDVAFQIRWQATQILVQAYFDKVGATWDFSEAAAKKYYNAHRGEFVQKEAVKAAHILTETESDALKAAVEAMNSGDFAATAQAFSRDPNSAQNGGDLGWVEKGMMVGAVDEAIMTGRPGQTVGPIQSEYGWHIIKIEARRAAKQLTFAEAGEAVMRSMQSSYIEQELTRLKAKFPVTVDEEVLKTIGGIPAPEPVQ